MRRTALSRSLSAKILLLTVACVLIGEVLIYVPSIARFRLAFLEERIAAAHLAMLNLSPRLALQLDMDTVDALLGARRGVRHHRAQCRRWSSDAGRDRPGRSRSSTCTTAAGRR